MYGEMNVKQITTNWAGIEKFPIPIHRGKFLMDRTNELNTITTNNYTINTITIY